MMTLFLIIFFFFKEIIKEICEQTDLMFKYNILAGNEEMSNLLKDLMKRIIRLDAFVQNYI